MDRIGVKWDADYQGINVLFSYWDSFVVVTAVVTSWNAFKEDQPRQGWETVMGDGDNIYVEYSNNEFVGRREKR
jgi:hypothetical protein